MHGNRMKGGRKEGVNELRAAAADNIACVHLAPPERDEHEKGGLSLYSAQGLPGRMACDFVACKGEVQGEALKPCASMVAIMVWKFPSFCCTIFTRREATRTGCLIFGLVKDYVK